MSHIRKGQSDANTPDAADDAAVFEAVAEAAEEMSLELESSSRVDKRMVGIFAAPVAHSSSPADAGDSGKKAPGMSDNELIEKALYGWAQTHPEDVVKLYGEYTTDPYAAVMPGGVQMITRDFLTKWIGSPEYRELLGQWSPKRERVASLTNIQIVHLSDSIANATFQGREVGEGDVPVIANGAAILIKESSGKETTWKIASVSKFGDFE